METINFRESADLGKILQKSAQFFRQNFIGICKASLLLVVIPFIIGSVFIGMGVSKMYSGMDENLGNPSYIFEYVWQLLPGYILMGVALVLTYVICLSYIKHYVNGVETITQKTVMQDVKKHFLKVFFGGLLIAIICYIGFFLCLVPGIYLAVVLSHLFAIAIVEDKSFGASFSKSFAIIKGNWWNSFLLYLVTSLIVAGISFLVILPTYIIMGVSMFKNVQSGTPEKMFESISGLAWFAPLYMVIYFITLVVTTIVQAANYYNLVERQEGIGEKSAIESVGN